MFQNETDIKLIERVYEKEVLGKAIESVVLDYVYTTPDWFENGAKKITKRRSVYTAPERICWKTSLLL